MRRFGILGVILLSTLTSTITRGEESFRAPAIPLVTHNPYFSIWQMSDRLTDEWPKHWTGTTHAICGMVRVDGKTYRFLGPQPSGVPNIPALEQTSIRITPTRTIATFKAETFEVLLTFLTPMLPDDLEVFSRPVTYITCDVRSTDGQQHPANVYFDFCSEIAVNSTDQVVMSTSVEPTKKGDIATISIGTVDQPVLKRKGDGVRIDWGHLVVGISASTGFSPQVGPAAEMRARFTSGDAKFTGSGMEKSCAVKDGWPVIAVDHPLGSIEKDWHRTTLMLAYDEDYSIEYLGTKLRPYWRKKFGNVTELLSQAQADQKSLEQKCAKFDESLTADAARAGGEKYAQLCALSYREAMAGHGLALSPDGRPFMFAKENSSNGCIGTVDVIYPAAPIFLLLSPKMMTANLEPVLEYADSPRWKFDFAPHDVGTYPLANGQVYGGGEKTEENQMPVEESANMILLVAALEKGLDAPTPLADKHRALLKKWADYLIAKGLDPERQLCTDDFSGHLAHNVNLSAKAILGIAAYGQICENHKDQTEGKHYIDQAREMATKWIEMAKDGDHTRLAFDKPGTWSQKYNLVWDRVLGLNLFPAEVARTELRFYKSKLNSYGLPLDNRAAFTKVDWTVWTACLAENNADFEALVNPLIRFAQDTPDRVPMTDWYQTDTAKAMSFRARPVMGGVFMKMLCDEKMWRKWSNSSTDN